METKNDRIIESEAPSKMVIPEVNPVGKGLIVTAFISTCVAIVLGVVAILFFISSIAIQENKTTTERNLANSEPAEYVSGVPMDRNIQMTDGESLQTSLGVTSSTGNKTNAMSDEKATVVMGVVVFGILSLMGLSAAALFTTIVYAIVLYKGWKTLQALRIIAPGAVLGMPTAGEAVGFMFIPYFSLYWMFPVCMGFEKYGTLMAKVRGLNYVGPTRSFAKMMCIFALLSIVFFPLFIVVVIMLFRMMLRVNDMTGVLGKAFAIERS